MKLIISILLIVTHIAALCYFLSLDYGYLNEHKAMRVIFFICPAFILPSLNSELRSELDDRYQLFIYSFHNLFSMVIGASYLLYYTGVVNYITKNMLIEVSVIFLTIFTVIVFCLFKHGFFKKQKTL